LRKNNFHSIGDQAGQRLDLLRLGSDRSRNIPRYTVVPGPHSIIYIHEATFSVVETIVSATEIDFSEAGTIFSAFPTSFFAAEIIISAAAKTAGAVPAVVSLNHRPTRR